MALIILEHLTIVSHAVVPTWSLSFVSFSKLASASIISSLPLDLTYSHILWRSLTPQHTSSHLLLCIWLAASLIEAALLT